MSAESRSNSSAAVSSEHTAASKQAGTPKPSRRMFFATAARRRLVPQVLLWLAFFALYAATTARDVLPADSGEFQLAAATWDILHPPGYPLYTVMGALWVRLLPLGNVAFRLNLLSAVLAATTLVLVARAVLGWTEAWGLPGAAATTGSLAAAALLGSAPTFWAQATTANIRMLTLLFGAWSFLALANYKQRLRQHTDTSRSLLSLALALGMGVGHHPSLIFIAVGWGVYLLLIDPSLPGQPRRWWKAVPVAALAWALPQLYLPLRGAAIEGLQLATPGLNTWDGFWHHVLARGFAGDMFAFANPADLALRLPLLNTLFTFQFPKPALLAMLGAWLWLLWRHHKLGIALGISWLIHTFVTLTYRAPQTVEYLMPAYLPMVLVFGLGVAHGVGLLQRRASKGLRSRLRFGVVIPVTLLVFIIILQFGWLLPDFATLAADTSIRARVSPLLEQAPADARILADWHWATPLWVLQHTEGLAPEAEVLYVYPEANQEYEQVWRARAEDAGSRPLFSTHAYDRSDFTASPVGGGFRLYVRPLTSLPPELNYARLDADLGPIRLLGYRIEGTVQPNGTLEAQFAWQAIGSQEPAPSLTVRLFDAQGNFLTNADRWLGSDTANDEVRFTHLTVQIPLNACFEALTPNVGVYTVDAGGFSNLGDFTLPALPMSCEPVALPIETTKPGIVLWGGPFLCGADYDTRVGATAYLHWCGPGDALLVHSGAAQALVLPLKIGQRQTVALPIEPGARPTFALTHLDGSPARLLAAPFAPASQGRIYVPFGNTMALTGATLSSRGGQQVLDLRWRAARPLVEDYAVSARLMAGEDFLGMHDMQPALSTIPTLKWVITGARVQDPHPFDAVNALPTSATIAVYERFRLTLIGEAATVPLIP